MVGVHIGLMLAHSNFQDYFNDNQPFCLETCCSNCTDVSCSSIKDINNNPYQCLSEEDAQNWHKKCLPTSKNYCRYTGRYFFKANCYVHNTHLLDFFPFDLFAITSD